MNLFPDLPHQPRPKPSLRWPKDVAVVCSPAQADYRETLTVSTEDDSEGIAPRTLIFIGANPSTANEANPDQTLATLWTRCHVKGIPDPASGFMLEERFHLWRADRMIVLNLYPARSTDPKGARDAIARGDVLPCPPVEQLLARELDKLQGADFRLLLGWGDCLGEHAGKLSAPVLRLCHTRKIQPWALTFTAKDRPGHPLYKPYSLGFVPVETTP